MTPPVLLALLSKPMITHALLYLLDIPHVLLAIAMFAKLPTMLNVVLVLMDFIWMLPPNFASNVLEPTVLSVVELPKPHVHSVKMDMLLI